MEGTSTQSNLLEVSEESVTTEASTSNSNNSSPNPMEGTSSQSNQMELSEASASGSNQRLEDLPKNEDDEFQKTNDVKIKFISVSRNRYKIDAGLYGTLKEVNECKKYALRKSKIEEVVDPDI